MKKILLTISMIISQQTYSAMLNSAIFTHQPTDSISLTPISEPNNNTSTINPLMRGAVACGLAYSAYKLITLACCSQKKSTQQDIIATPIAIDPKDETIAIVIVGPKIRHNRSIRS